VSEIPILKRKEETEFCAEANWYMQNVFRGDCYETSGSIVTGISWTAEKAKYCMINDVSVWTNWGQIAKQSEGVPTVNIHASTAVIVQATLSRILTVYMFWKNMLPCSVWRLYVLLAAGHIQDRKWVFYFLFSQLCLRFPLT
jgi:hypothetical protein